MTFDPGTPFVAGNLIEDEDGAPLPHELQRGGRISLAVWDMLIERMPGEASPDQMVDCHEAVLTAIAPILWPLLPSNGSSDVAVRDAKLAAVAGLCDAYDIELRLDVPHDHQVSDRDTTWCWQTDPALRGGVPIRRIRAVLSSVSTSPTEDETQCDGTLGSRPSWMSPGQYRACRCKRVNGHVGDHQCEHTDASLAGAFPASVNHDASPSTSPEQDEQR